MELDVDFAAAESWNADMPERLRELRDASPVFWSEKTQHWIITRYDDVVAISKNPGLFCSGQGVRPGMVVRQSLIDEDDPHHTTLRKLVNKGFTPRMVARLEETFVDITREAVDAVAKQGECDFVHDIAVPLPLLLIAEMIGIRKEDRHKFHEWSDAMIAGDGNFDDAEIMARAAKAFGEYADYVTKIIEDRRREPKDDLISVLTGAAEAGLIGSFGSDERGSVEEKLGEERAPLANDELIMLCVLFLVAGNETTRNGLSGAMELLIEHPDARRRLVDDPSLIPDAVEELLRLVTPVLCFARTATRDTELRGQKIAEGEKVLLVYPAANRDPDAFDSPDDLRIDRKPHHVSFGIGAHFCLGANLARMELRVALSEVLRRLPDMELVGDGPEFSPNALVRSCTRMPVRFTPEGGV